MSEVDSKVHPPGSWPGAKGKTDKAGDDPTEPRFSPALAKETGGEPFDTASQGNYTHQRDSGIEDEGEPIEMREGSLKHVDPDPIDGGTDRDAQSEAPLHEIPEQQEKEQPAEEENKGWGSTVASVAGGAKNLASLGQNTASSALKSGQDTIDKAQGQLPDGEKAADDIPAAAGEKKDEVAEKVPGADDAQEKVEEAEDGIPSTEDAKEKVEEAKEGIPSTGGITKTADDATDKTKDAIPSTEDAPKVAEDAKDTAPGAEDAEKLAEGAKDAAPGTEDAEKAAEDAKAAVPETGEATTAAEGAKDEVAKEGEAAADTAGQVTEDAEPPLDFSILKGGKINKGGNVVDPDGKLLGRVKEGVLVNLIGKKVDEDGNIWSDSGKIIGKAEPIPESERDSLTKESGPFESFPDAVVNGDGMVVSNGETIGKVIEGDVKVLRGKSVDPDGEILDRSGNVVGKAERWEAEKEPEPEPEPEVDRSILAGKRVNKAGNVVDGNGVIFGRVVEGDPKRMIGRMADKNGNILSESGDILGRAEVVPEGEREGMKEGPFAELSGCTVSKDGKVVTPGGDVVGRLISGDPKVLYGRAVDEDGDVVDKNGNVLGKAERWEEPVVEKKKNALSGRKVNREGNVVDEDGNLVGKLTSGQLSICAGKEIDDDGDVVDGKGNTIGHVSLLEDIPAAEPEESAEDKQKREQAEQDKKLAKQMAGCLEQCLDKIKPICTMITEKIDRAERTPKEELDEEELVKQVRPLIEEGSKILQEANGIIRGLDPDGRIQANAKHKTATRDASQEEFHLAEVLKELTANVTQTIENAKKKIEGMPHAKKELNPLWGLLNEPLFQIIAAVGLLLNGVLSLLGRLLQGLGLGGILDGLLGTLGLNRVLEGLGLGSVTGALTGKDKDKKKKGGLLGLGG